MPIEIIPASDQEAWLKLRDKDVTSSAAPALLGVHPYLTAFELAAEKSGKLTNDRSPTKSMLRGILMESVAVDIIREEHPDWNVHHNAGDVRLYYRDPVARIGATPDILVYEKSGRKGLIEVKNTHESIYRKTWRMDDGTIEPPLGYAVQALLAGHLVGVDWIAVAPIVIGRGVELEIIEIPPRPAVIDLLYEKVREFWSLIDAGKELPLDFARDGGVLDRLFGNDDGSEMQLPPRADAIVAEHAREKAAMDVAKERIDTLKTEMKSILGNHAAGVFSDGRRVTWKTINRKGYTVAPTQYRQLRFPS